MIYNVPTLRRYCQLPCRVGAKIGVQPPANSIRNWASTWSRTGKHSWRVRNGLQASALGGTNVPLQCVGETCHERAEILNTGEVRGTRGAAVETAETVTQQITRNWKNGMSTGERAREAWRVVRCACRCGRSSRLPSTSRPPGNFPRPGGVQGCEWPGLRAEACIRPSR